MNKFVERYKNLLPVNLDDPIAIRVSFDVVVNEIAMSGTISDLKALIDIHDEASSSWLYNDPVNEMEGFRNGTYNKAI